MRTIFLFAFTCLANVFVVGAEPTVSVAPGAVWQYEIIGAATTNSQPSTMIVRAVGTEKSNEQELVRLETRIDDALIKTEIVSGNDGGFLCYRRISPEGKITTFNPPQAIVPAPLSLGTKWETDEVIAGNPMHLRFEIVAEEDVEVAGGTFHAFRAQCDQPWPLSITLERWLVSDVGMVKEVASTRDPGGRLLHRTTTALTKFSRGPLAASEPGPSVMVPSSSPPPPPSFKLEIAIEREGDARAEIKSDAPNIFVRWSGENLLVHSIVRIDWVAENVGDVAPPNFVVDETKTEVAQPDFAARFTLSRPKDGWAAGKYRVDLFLDDQLQATAKVTIRD